MPYADELVRVAIRWAPPPGDGWGGEQAVTTWHLRHHHITGNGFTWHDQMPHLATALQGKFSSHWASMSATHATDAEIIEIKVAHIDTAGHDVDVAAVTPTSGTFVGSGGTSMLPPEVALVVSSWGYNPGTFAARKGRRRGRFYLPYIASGMSSGHGRVDATHQGATTTAWLDFFNDVQGMHTFNEDTPPDPNPDYWDFVVVSGVDGTWENVNYLSIDDVFDSQRRRQHQGPTPTRMKGVISHA